LTATDRSKNRKAFNAELNKLTEKKSTETWVKELNRPVCPAADLIDRPDF
jgi:hypothetical protein